VLEALNIKNGDDIPEFEQEEGVVDAEIPARRAAFSNRRLSLRASCLFSFLLLCFGIPRASAKQTPHQLALTTTHTAQNTRLHGKSNFVVWCKPHFSTLHLLTSLAAAVKL